MNIDKFIIKKQQIYIRYIQRNIKLTRAVDVDINAILSAVSILYKIFFRRSSSNIVLL